MNDKLMKTLYFFVAFCGLSILFAIYDGAKDYQHLNKETRTYSNKKDKQILTVYYFWNGIEYIKADSQKFRIIFTGEVVNAYFIVGNKEYSTLNYYKEIK